MTYNYHLPAYGYVLGAIKSGLIHATVGLPPEAWWLPAIVAAILALAATLDAIKATIPDPLILSGLLAVAATQGVYVSWPFAGWHLMIAIGAGVFLWTINQMWLLAFKHDAIGMGDAKWTMLAIGCFDLNPTLFAWGLGACIATVWLGAARLMRYEISRVYFAPFLFIGLMTGIYWLRLR